MERLLLVIEAIRLPLTVVSVVSLAYRVCRTFAPEPMRFMRAGLRHPVRLMHGDILCPDCHGMRQVKGLPCFFCAECSSQPAKKGGLSLDEFRWGFVSIGYLKAKRREPPPPARIYW